MDDVAGARHGENETSAAGVVGRDVRLTKLGRPQAGERGTRPSNTSGSSLGSMRSEKERAARRLEACCEAAAW